MATTARAPQPELSFLDFGRARLDALWRAVHHRDCPDDVRTRFTGLFETWGARAVGRTPRWPSDIGDDHSPFEFSLVLGGAEPELRVLLEAQGQEPTYASTRQAALDLNAVLEHDGADLSRLRAVQSLFLHDAPGSLFSLWHAASLVPGAPHYKAYLNPRVGEPGTSFALASEALERLGLQAAVPTFESARQSPEDDVRYFGIDLKRTEKSRVKVYLYQPGATTAHYERLAAMAPSYRPGEATALCRALTGFDGPYTRYPLCTYLSFVEGSERPYEVTIQVPIRFYCPDDQIARSRVLAFLESRHLDPQPYDDALYALARRPLSRGSGLQTYVSLRLGEPTPRVAVYLSVEAYAADPRYSSGVRRAI